MPCGLILLEFLIATAVITALIYEKDVKALEDRVFDALYLRFVSWQDTIKMKLGNK